jgi:hypothetical protein
MLEPLQRYNALSPEARKLFRRAALLLPMLGASLRFRGYNRTQQWLEKKLERRAIAPPQEEDISGSLELTCRMVRAAQHYSLLHSSCLEQSLLLWYLLQRQGITVAMRIGVRKDAEKFEAHAWVEHGGVALNQAEELHQHYAAFDNEFSKLPAERP